MKHHTNPRFWRCYQGLPKEIRDLADRNHAVLKSDPAHSSLHFKKIGPLWSVRVGLHYRLVSWCKGARTSNRGSLSRGFFVTRGAGKGRGGSTSAAVRV